MDNKVVVGLDGGTGTLLVENGGTLETINLEVGRDRTNTSGSTGTATVRGKGSTIIVSTEGGLFSAPYDYEAGFARVGRGVPR